MNLLKGPMISQCKWQPVNSHELQVQHIQSYYDNNSTTVLW